MPFRKQVLTFGQDRIFVFKKQLFFAFFVRLSEDGAIGKQSFGARDGFWKKWLIL